MQASYSKIHPKCKERLKYEGERQVLQTSMHSAISNLEFSFIETKTKIEAIN